MNKFITIYFLFAWSSVFAQRTTLPNTATQSPSNKNLYNANGQVITGRLVVNDSCWFNGDQSLFDGNVGIGTTSPNAKLSIYDVGGPGGATTFYWRNTSYSGDTTFASYTGTISHSIEVFDSTGAQTGLIALTSPFATLSGKAELQFALNGNTYFTGEGNVGIGTVSPDFNLHVAGSFFAEKTVGGRTVHMVIDTFAGFTQILYEFTSGDTSNVMGVTPGDAFMRANTDGTDYDVIMNISDPGGVKIQGKSTTTGNALTILEGDSTIFAGDTLFRFGNNGTMQVYGMAGAGTRYVTTSSTGVLGTDNMPWTYYNDSTIMFIHDDDTVFIGYTGTTATVLHYTTPVLSIGSGDINQMTIEQNNDGFGFSMGGHQVARIDSSNGAPGETGLMLWDLDNGTVERVTVGAPNSGGAGYKVLRIPN